MKRRALIAGAVAATLVGAGAAGLALRAIAPASAGAEAPPPVAALPADPTLAGAGQLASSVATTAPPAAQTTAPVSPESRPIRRYAALIPDGAPVIVQAGVGPGVWKTSYPWRDQARVSTGWEGFINGRKVLETRDIALSPNGMPLFPDRAPPALLFQPRSLLWAGGQTEGFENVHGTWRATAGSESEIAVAADGRGSGRVLSTSPREITFECEKRRDCFVRLQIKDASPDAGSPSLVQLTDGEGRSVDDAARPDLVTRELWRRANYGYSALRMMDASGATYTDASTIRFDDFPAMDHTSWHEFGPKVEFRKKPGFRDIAARTGIESSFTPVESRLRAAWELGALYHHNFPHLVFEHRGRVKPDVIGEWFRRLWDDAAVPTEAKLSLLNDTELQHIDEFAELIANNRDYAVDNAVLVEISNEVWNFAHPYHIQNNYFQRKTADRADEMGRAAPRGRLNEIGLGYASAQMVARLRKVAPQIEWRGVLAVQTSLTATHKGRVWVDTPSGAYNTSLGEVMRGYRLFWDDYETNKEAWADFYAPEPAQPGDWFEVHGTTYYGLGAKNKAGENIFLGMDRRTFERRVADRAEWPELRRDALQWYINGPARRNSLRRDAGRLIALAETAAAYGMETASYEGGNHTDPGAAMRARFEETPGLKAFWTDFSQSLELALIQAALHDAAVYDAGWRSLSDYMLFSEQQGWHVFGTRANFFDASPRWCEYARWMPAQPAVPPAMAALADLETPHARCGGLVELFKDARANGYYVGKPLPTVAAAIAGEQP